MIKWTLGQKIQGQVEEIVNSNGIIFSFAGKLLRVKNMTAKQLQPGETIYLVVIKANPVEFQLDPQFYPQAQSRFQRFV